MSGGPVLNGLWSVRTATDGLGRAPWATIAQRDVSKDAEVLVLRHENAVPRRNAGRVRYDRADPAWFAALTGSFRGGAGPGSSP